MQTLTAAGTYEQISKEDLETWLNDIRPLYEGHWRIAPRTVGVYWLPLSKNVAVALSSTIGRREDAMGNGKASMQLALVSMVTGQTLNRKAQDQSHFKRTKNWRDTWKVGIVRMKEAFVKASGFYEAIAVIEDREKYKKDLLTRLEALPNAHTEDILVSFAQRVRDGGVLTEKQIAVIEAKERNLPRNPAPISKLPVVVDSSKPEVKQPEVSGQQGLNYYQAQLDRADDLSPIAVQDDDGSSPHLYYDLHARVLRQFWYEVKKRQDTDLLRMVTNAGKKTAEQKGFPTREEKAQIGAAMKSWGWSWSPK